MAINKRKVLFTLHSSKTSGPESRPQKIKISGNTVLDKKTSVTKEQSQHFCPVQITDAYLKMRGDYRILNEQFFVFQGGLPLEQHIARMVLSNLIESSGLNKNLYSFQSFRSGRATNLFDWGVPVEQIQLVGRWKSNAVYKYLKL